jgi:tetratricopeptide (TPR) repeat protein
MDRILAFSGLVLAVSAAWALHALDPSGRPDSIGVRLSKETNPAARVDAATVFAQAVRADSANAYLWEDLAEALAAAGKLNEARQASKRATDLAGGIPQIWFRDASLHFQYGEIALGLRSVKRIFEEVDDYDYVFFDYFDQLKLKPSDVLAEIEQNRRASRSYFEHLIAVNSVDGAQEAWPMLRARGFIDQHLSAMYIACLLRNHLYEAAQQEWAASQQPSNYPDRNLVYNGDFERDFTNCPLDWGIQPSENVEVSRDDSVAHDGRWSLKIDFQGNSNIAYENITQTVVVHPGVHHLRAWVRTEAITSDEGIRLEIFDPANPARFEMRTDTVAGSHDWTLIESSFTIPQFTRVIALRVIRTPSSMFSNAINGTTWLDSVSLKEGS